MLKLFKYLKIPFSHSPRAVVFFKVSANLASVYTADLAQRSNSSIATIDNEAIYVVGNYFGNRSMGISNNGGATRHRLDHHHAEWFRPVDREKQRPGTTEEFILSIFTYLTDEFNKWLFN